MERGVVLSRNHLFERQEEGGGIKESGQGDRIGKEDS